ncbi:MobH family relaxase [Mannheimia haemolytica]|uniref:MobH family relaxase n=1 Tax=Mannheimia haemolytica TaxID=75985 RepID=UPI00201C2B3C|nr:MobH family relaxase [Mannheimia haemolytica]MDW0617847.1 MobH family relaxase [Mannheimia haemolytica]UQX68785.1 TraI domain-containing protein [Mannheimia haemolytica]
MLKLLEKLRPRKKPNNQDHSQTIIDSPAGWHSPMSAQRLLDTPLRQQYITTIWQNVSMSPKMFDLLYQTPINRYVEMVQLLPASESHHHSHLGGMIDHGLEVIAVASKLRQSYVLPPNAAPEDQAKQRDVWTAVVIYAALIHDIGKIATDLEIVLLDGSRWFPWQGIPKQPYNFRYIKGRDYHLHPALGGFFASQLIPQEAFDWIAPFTEAFSQLMYFAANHADKAGILGEIIQKADQYSVAMALGGELTKLSEKPKASFAKQLHLALQEVVKSYKLNTPRGGGQGWLTDSGLWVMSKTTADSVRAYLSGQGISAPSKNGAMFDELIAHNLIEATSDKAAIWDAKVCANSGWSSGKFTMLKIRPTVIWENIDERPELFEGSVLLVDKDNNVLPTSKVVSEIATVTLPVTELNTQEQLDAAPVLDVQEAVKDSFLQQDVQTFNSIDEIKIEENGGDDMDMVLSLFSDSPMPFTETESNQVETEAEHKIAIPQETEAVIENRSNLPEKGDINVPQLKQTASSEIEAEFSIDVQNFIDWIKSSVLSGKLPMNQTNAKLHFVEDHLFMVTPSIFQVYCAEVIGNVEKSTWERLQKQFQNLAIHKRQHTDDGDSRNIWTCKIAGPNRSSTLNGYLIENVELFVGNKLVINNQWLTLKGKIQ